MNRKIAELRDPRVFWSHCIRSLLACSVFAAVGCASLEKKHPYSFHVTSFVTYDVKDVRLRADGVDMRLGTFGPGHGYSELYYEGNSWPSVVQLSWTDTRSGADVDKTFPVLEPRAQPKDGHWRIAILFFDDELIVRVLERVHKWDPVLKGAPVHYGDDLAPRIESYFKWLDERKPDGGMSEKKYTHRAGTEPR